MPSNEPRCTCCHIGYGYANKEIDFTVEANVDCIFPQAPAPVDAASASISGSTNLWIALVVIIEVAYFSMRGKKE